MTDPSLSLVSYDDELVATVDAAAPEEPTTRERGAIPAFEGHVVHATKAKITSVNALEVGDRVFRVDESVKLIVEAKVTSVHHQTNESTHEMFRVHTLKAGTVIVIDWAVDMDQLIAAFRD